MFTIDANVVSSEMRHVNILKLKVIIPLKKINWLFQKTLSVTVKEEIIN